MHTYVDQIRSYNIISAGYMQVSACPWECFAPAFCWWSRTESYLLTEFHLMNKVPSGFNFAIFICRGWGRVDVFVFFRCVLGSSSAEGHETTRKIEPLCADI